MFDQICSFGLYVIRYVMFLCFQVHFRTKQSKWFLAYVMLNIKCFYVFMFLGMLQYLFTYDMSRVTDENFSAGVSTSWQVPIYFHQFLLAFPQ